MARRDREFITLPKEGDFTPMPQMSHSTPCLGFPVPVMFTDVDPDVLADEEATEQHRYVVRENGAWQTYMRRVLPAMERGSSAEMAQALLDAGTDDAAAIIHSKSMRRRALATGDVRRARFWADVTDAIRLG